MLRAQRFRNLVTLALILSPLSFSFDGDRNRSYEVLAVAVVAVGLVLVERLRGLRLWPDIALVFLYDLVVIGQQFFITGGSPAFGAQYAIVMTAMFIPGRAVLAEALTSPHFVRVADIAVNVLGGVAVLSIYASFFLGVGEIYRETITTRAFAWLGDSFTPVIILLVLYFVFQRKWLRAALALGALLMTGGKAGMIMLATTPVIYVLVSPTRLVRKVAILLVVSIGSMILYENWEFFSERLLEDYEYSYNDRVISMDFGVQYFEENPLLGIGINQSMKIIDMDSNYWISGLKLRSYEIYQINNAFVRTAAETGIFGLSLLILMSGVWIGRSVRAIRHSCKWRHSRERSLVLACGLWTISFVVIYQSTGWFEAGHPQLAWMLMISAMSEAVFRKAATGNAFRVHVPKPKTPRAPVFDLVGRGL